jgi:hypothetical protein
VATDRRILLGHPFSPEELVAELNARMPASSAITLERYRDFILAIATVQHQGHFERPDEYIPVKDPHTGKVIGKELAPHVDEKGVRLKQDHPYDVIEEKLRKMIETSLQEHLKLSRGANRWPENFNPPKGIPSPDSAPSPPPPPQGVSGARTVARDGTVEKAQPE